MISVIITVPKMHGSTPPSVLPARGKSQKNWNQFHCSATRNEAMAGSARTRWAV